MIYVDSLTESETNSLQEIIREPLSVCTRKRATAILLSDHKISLQIIASISGVCRQTASIWLTNWKERGIDGLIDKHRSGRPLSSAQELEIIEMVEKSPRSLKKVLAEIEKRWKIKLSKTTLKQLCKKAKLSHARGSGLTFDIDIIAVHKGI